MNENDLKNVRYTAMVMKKQLIISQMIKKKTRSYVRASIMGNNFIFILPFVFSECKYASPVTVSCYDVTFQRFSTDVCVQIKI